jgi:hypothetical protein
VDIIEHALEELRREMGVMHMQLQEVTLEHNALHEKLATCQKNVMG